MNKAGLIKTVSELEALNPELVKRILERTFTVIETSLVNGEGVTVRGLGEWQIIHREAGKARNPHSGETIEVPERLGIKYKVAPTLRNKIRGI